MRLFRSKTRRSSLAASTGDSRVLRASAFLPAAQAGGGPENVLLVVNSADSDSMTIANHYVQLRQIPPSNVMYLNWRGPPAKTDINTFREKILTPCWGRWMPARYRPKSIMSFIPAVSLGDRFSMRRAASLRNDPQVQNNHEGSLSGLTYLISGRFERCRHLHQPVPQPLFRRQPVHAAARKSEWQNLGDFRPVPMVLSCRAADRLTAMSNSPRR